MTPVTKNLTLQVRKLTLLSTEELNRVKTFCDEIYVYIKEQSNASPIHNIDGYKMEVEYHNTIPSDPNAVFRVIIHGTNGEVEVTLAEAQKLLSSTSLETKCVSVNGKTRVLKQIPICANCNKGYGKNPPFPRNNNGTCCGGICTRCKDVRYCSRDCQREHWSIHKKTCKKRT